jgi:hypothetical protein
VHSIVLLVLVACILALPGIAASLVVFPPGEASIVTRLAAVFGLGYAASAGCAFLLAAAHAFHFGFFIALWLAVSAVLWVAALRRGSLRDHARALRGDIAANLLWLLLGALVIAVLLILHLKFINMLGASRYVYYQGGLQIANTGGVPSASLEYGQSWAPATDKIVLDAFTGIVVLLDPNAAIGPGVLLWFSLLGSALGLWATGWELGLRRTSILLPLLVVNNQVLSKIGSILHPVTVLHARHVRVSTDFTEYRAEDFGRAVAFCALALGIYAIRKQKWGPALAAGVVLAAASGTHLIPAAVVAIALFFVGVAELLRAGGKRARLIVLRQFAVLSSASAVVAVLIRVFAGGTFGLGGASSPSGYAALHMSFDPTAYLFSGAFVPWGPSAAGGGHWYYSPWHVVDHIMGGADIHWPAWATWLLFAAVLAAAVLLFLFAQGDLRIAGIVGGGLLAALIGTALFFSYSYYHVYVDGSFGYRRLADFSIIGLAIVGLGVLEALLEYLGRHWSWASLTAAVAIIVVLSALVLPASAVSGPLGSVSRERVSLINWLRGHTPCNARFLVNQRTEGAFTVLTGRFALLEGMGPFLRVDKLPYVINLFLAARHFFEDPLSHEAFLRQHDISYVVVTGQNQLLGYTGQTGKANEDGLRAAPFLHPILTRPYVTVYQVQGSNPLPVSPLLKGPYIHCMTSRVHF